MIIYSQSLPIFWGKIEMDNLGIERGVYRLVKGFYIFVNKITNLLDNPVLFLKLFHIFVNKITNLIDNHACFTKIVPPFWPMK